MAVLFLGLLVLEVQVAAAMGLVVTALELLAPQIQVVVEVVAVARQAQAEQAAPVS